MKVDKYTTLEDFMSAVKKQPGFENVDKFDKIEAKIESDVGSEFIYKKRKV